ncbi:MAG: hypothetical protein JWN52_5000 [Actinomycetia bacterium]|nr:hypothetical protein [Actinomycetes bacterium]
MLSNVGNHVAGDGRPADRQHHRFLFGAPGMIDTLTPHHVVALLGQKHATSWQLYPKPAADQQEKGSALLSCDPLRTLIARWMHAPFDFDLVTVPGIIDRLEVSE